MTKTTCDPRALQWVEKFKKEGKNEVEVAISLMYSVIRNINSLRNGVIEEAKENESLLEHLGAIMVLDDNLKDATDALYAYIQSFDERNRNLHIKSNCRRLCENVYALLDIVKKDKYQTQLPRVHVEFPGEGDAQG